MPNNFFLTGYPGGGKSSLISKIIRDLEIKPGGFLTRRQVLPDGKEQIILFPAEKILNDTKTGIILASRQNFKLTWQINLEAFNRQGVKLLAEGVQDREILIMDELGRFELQACKFQQQVFAALAAKKPVLGVLKYERNNFLNQIWDDPGVEVNWMEREKKDELYQYLIDQLLAIINP